MTMMSKQAMRDMSAQGNSDWEVLSAAVQSGYEYPDAVWAVSQALRMDEEQREEMEDNYDNLC